MAPGRGEYRRLDDLTDSEDGGTPIPLQRDQSSPAPRTPLSIEQVTPAPAAWHGAGEEEMPGTNGLTPYKLRQTPLSARSGWRADSIRSLRALHQATWVKRPHPAMLRCVGWSAVVAAFFLGLFLTFVVYEEDFRATIPNCTWQNYRLPDAPTPTVYSLVLEVGLNHDPFPVRGSVEIEVDLGDEVGRCIVLHAGRAVDVTDSDIQYVDASGKRVSMQHRIDRNTEPGLEDQLVVSLHSPVPSREERHGNTQGYLTLRFHYNLPRALGGLYLSPYVQNGRPKALAVTQLEAIDARNAFPCFDEPDAKASFDVTVTVPSWAVVLSNMPVSTLQSSERLPRRHHLAASLEALKTMQFQRTPPMPTYLLAILAGDVSSASLAVERGLPGLPTLAVEVHGLSHRPSSSLGTAGDVAAQVVPAMERLLRIPYDLPKLDLAAVPDLAAGAMENWGLVTFKETTLLVSETTPTSGKRAVAELVAHELTHMWFGNRVTMAWWDDVWLNEGSATYFARVGADAAMPQFSFLANTYWDVTRVGLDADAHADRHPLAPGRLPGGDANANVDALFDHITYEKGGAVLHMAHTLARALGGDVGFAGPTPFDAALAGGGATRDAFIEGLEGYLRRHHLGPRAGAGGGLGPGGGRRPGPGAARGQGVPRAVDLPRGVPGRDGVLGSSLHAATDSGPLLRLRRRPLRPHRRLARPRGPPHRGHPRRLPGAPLRGGGRPREAGRVRGARRPVGRAGG